MEGRLTFQKSGTPSKEIKNHPLPLPQFQQIRQGQAALVPFIILGEDVLEILGSEPSLVIIRHTITAMFVFVEAGSVDAKQGVRKVARDGGIGEVEIDDEGREQTQRNCPAPGAEAVVGILRPDDAIMVWVPIFDMLDDDLIAISKKFLPGLIGGTYGLMLMTSSVVPLRGPVRRLFGCGDVGPRGTRILEDISFLGNIGFS